MELIGDVTDKNVIIVDDMVDTAGTLTKAANLMVERGAKSAGPLQLTHFFRQCLRKNRGI